MRKALVVFIAGVLTTHCLINCTGLGSRENAHIPQNEKSKIVGGGCDGCELIQVRGGWRKDSAYL
jgi:hypothetical protein